MFCFKSFFALSAATLALSTLAVAAPIGVDGTKGSEWNGITPVMVTYAPGTTESNFGSPTPFDDKVTYDIYTRSDSSYVYFLLQTMPSGVDEYDAGLNFANVYFGTGASANTGSDLGIEVTNDRAFVPGVAGYYPLSPSDFVFAGTSGTYNGTPGSGPGNTIEFALSWNYLMTDPQGLGFDKISAANPQITLRLSQSFSYSVGGGATYGPTRLGTDLYSSSEVPEPASFGLIATVGLTLGLIRRRVSSKA